MRPEQVGDVLALMGDSIDNVPGVAGIGPKTAAELINKYGIAGRAAGGARARSRASAGEAHRRRRARRSRLARAGAPARRRAAAQDARRAAPDRARQDQPARAVPRARVLPPGRPAVTVGRGGDRAARGERRRRPSVAARGARAAVAAAPPPVARGHSTRAGLAALAARHRAAGAVGLAALYDGPSAVRSDLVGLGVRAAGRQRARLPAALPPLPGRADAACPSGGPGGAGAGAGVDPPIAKHVHDAKTLEVLLRARGD